MVIFDNLEFKKLFNYLTKIYKSIEPRKLVRLFPFIQKSLFFKG